MFIFSSPFRILLALRARVINRKKESKNISHSAWGILYTCDCVGAALSSRFLFILKIVNSVGVYNSGGELQKIKVQLVWVPGSGLFLTSLEGCKELA